MAVAAGKEVPSQWSFKVSYSFVEVPPEREAAFWAAMDYFARVMFTPLTLPAASPPNNEGQERDLGEKDGECSEVLVDGTRVTAVDGQE